MLSQEKKLLIAAVTPSFLEKEVDWFIQNFNNILESRARDTFWQRNTVVIEINQTISLSEFLRRLTELGYTKAWEVRHKGEFSQHGGTISVFPINTDKTYTIEFDGNIISEIQTANVPGENHLSPSRLNPSRVRVGSDADSVSKRFSPGDYVVHIDHGIGIFRGYTSTSNLEAKLPSDDLIIEYAAPMRSNTPDTLFVPKEIAEKRLQPYLGFKKPTIHRLGTSVWSITKKKAKEDIVAFAKSILETLAKRHQITRPPYQSSPEQEDSLEASFLHEDTPDQKRALKEIFDDMARLYPMDRILMGDVGFGKTELALRATLRVVLNERQVVIIAPTTILADQHYETFKKRLEPFGINVTRLTRLESAEQIKKTIHHIQNGAVDVVIGTHKLLGKHIMFKNLGLLIIDEEQKFGVAHKEHFKKTNPALDILTLSATPIPRTLNLGLSKIQALSHIETAPQGRMEIKTFVLPKNQLTIKRAMEFELARGGQIYFLANRIHKIPQLLEEIKKLKINVSEQTPEPLISSRLNPSRVQVGPTPTQKTKGSVVRVGVLHGRMHEKEILKTIHAFREQKINCLVSTTIIENGLDISSANTLIVENATLLGLSDAHQLRGRIGRGNQEAYAYFFYPSHKLGEKAAERLEALERYSWLGAGVEIAKRDLELRGCGNILGRAQSGIAYRVGLNLYFQLLEEAISELDSPCPTIGRRATPK